MQYLSGKEVILPTSKVGRHHHEDGYVSQIKAALDARKLRGPANYALDVLSDHLELKHNPLSHAMDVTCQLDHMKVGLRILGTP